MLASMHNVHACTHDTSSTACIQLHVVQVPVGKGTEVQSSLPNEENATACRRRYMAITVANAVLHQIPKVLRLLAVFNHERYSCMHVMNTIKTFFMIIFFIEKITNSFRTHDLAVAYCYNMHLIKHLCTLYCQLLLQFNF